MLRIRRSKAHVDEHKGEYMALTQKQQKIEHLQTYMKDIKIQVVELYEKQEQNFADVKELSALIERIEKR